MSFYKVQNTRSGKEDILLVWSVDDISPLEWNVIIFLRKEA